MIRQATKDDTKGIISLWTECFPEDLSFSHYFFRNIYDYKNSIVIEKDGVICSTLQRIPFYIENVGKVSYIYGAGTLTEYRSQGLMKKLLEHSELMDRKQKLSASILIPQNKGLFDYYYHFGFEDTFSLRKKTYTPSDAQNSLEIRTATTEDNIKIKNFYSKILKGTDYLYRKPDFIKQQIEMFSALGGKIFLLYENKTLQGYAFVWHSDEETYAQEIMCKDKYFTQILADKIIEFYSLDNLLTYSLSSQPDAELGSIKYYNKKADNLKVNLLYN